MEHHRNIKTKPYDNANERAGLFTLSFFTFFSLNRDCLSGKFLFKNKVTNRLPTEIKMINTANIKLNVSLGLQIITSIIIKIKAAQKGAENSGN